MDICYKALKISNNIGDKGNITASSMKAMLEQVNGNKPMAYGLGRYETAWKSR